MEDAEFGTPPSGDPVQLPHLVRLLAGFLLLAGPLVLLVWHELNELLLGRVHPIPLAVAAALLGVLIALATGLGRRLRQLHEDF